MSKEDEEGKQILTRDEALYLLKGVNSYFADKDDYLLGKHRTEILADAMLREGYSDLSRTVVEVHNTLKEFHQGKYINIDVLFTSDTVDSCLKQSEGTQYERAVNDVMGFLCKLTERLSDHDVDWKGSASVILHTKQECFPGDLTMTEKLALWQQGHSRSQAP